MIHSFMYMKMQYCFVFIKKKIKLNILAEVVSCRVLLNIIIAK